MTTHYRARGTKDQAAGPWREFLTLAQMDAIQAGGTGKDEEIELSCASDHEPRMPAGWTREWHEEIPLPGTQDPFGPIVGNNGEILVNAGGEFIWRKATPTELRDMKRDSQQRTREMENDL